MDRNAEIAEKRRRLREFLQAEGLDAVVFETQAYYSWYTGGGENRVVIGSDLGAAYVFATGEKDWVVTSNIEATRLGREDLAGTDSFDVVSVPWHDDSAVGRELGRLGRGKRCVSDTGAFGLPRLPAAFAEKTYSLTDREIERYRALGRDSSEAIEAAMMRLEPGVTEHQIAAEIGRELLARGVIPQVLLVAGDERTRLHRHPLATDLKVQRSAMGVLCGKRGGLIASATRMIHFGQLDADLRRRHDAVAAVDAAYINGTRVGRPLEDVFADGKAAYERAGFGDEWTLHHQGGPTGYQGRSYRGKPGEKRPVLDRQAFAWNPSIAGTKSEDTVLVLGDSREVLTAPVAWPTIEVDGLKRADFLVI